MLAVADVQFEQVDDVFLPVQMEPAASVVAVVAGARRGLDGSVRSFQLLETRTSSSARCTPTLVGMLYLVAIRAMLSVLLICRIACTLD